MTMEKVRLLTTSLLTAEAWKEKILPQIASHVAKLSSFKSYMCLYHEASVGNLMEVLMYHRTAVTSDEDSLVELIDYCYRKLVALTARQEEFEKAQTVKPDPEDAKKLLSQTP